MHSQSSCFERIHAAAGDFTTGRSWPHPRPAPAAEHIGNLHSSINKCAPPAQPIAPADRACLLLAPPEVLRSSAHYSIPGSIVYRPGHFGTLPTESASRNTRGALMLPAYAHQQRHGARTSGELAHLSFLTSTADLHLHAWLPFPAHAAHAHAEIDKTNRQRPPQPAPTNACTLPVADSKN